MVLEQMLHPVPKMMARRNRIVSVRPHVAMLDRLDMVVVGGVMLFVLLPK